jgi:hypothetical protein
MNSVRRKFVLLAVGGLAAFVPPPLASQGTWTPTSTEGVPAARAGHTAVWTGSRMIVWGGMDFSFLRSLADGGAYEPGSGAWTPTRTTGAPSPRQSHTAVWTGSRMIVWGGCDWETRAWFDSGGAYDPVRDAWTATSRIGAPAPRSGQTSVWTGSQMIVWGGLGSAESWLGDGGAYEPATDRWTAISRTGAPSPRSGHTAVWTGSKMIVWGGYGETGLVGTGGVYDPATDTWRAVSPSDAPSPRTRHTAVWTGSRMIVWGGEWFAGDTEDTPGTGAIYDPVTDSWTPTTTAGAPVSRASHTAVWAGSRMIVWGGRRAGLPPTYSTGGLFDPATQTWTATPTLDAPGQRGGHTAVWTGWQMVVWGGVTPELHVYSSGGAYAAGLAGSPTALYTVTPCRVVDTRGPAGPLGGPALAGGETRTFPLAGTACAIESTAVAAVAVSVTLTAVDPAATGYLTLFPGDGVGPPVASSVNFSAGQTRANNAVVPLAADGTGTIKVSNKSAGAVHVVLDVNGYFR